MSADPHMRAPRPATVSGSISRSLADCCSTVSMLSNAMLKIGLQDLPESNVTWRQGALVSEIVAAEMLAPRSARHIDAIVKKHSESLQIRLWVANALKVSKDDGTPIQSRTNLRARASWSCFSKAVASWLRKMSELGLTTLDNPD